MSGSSSSKYLSSMHILQINVFLPSIIDKILKQTIKQKLHVILTVTHRQNIQTDGKTETTVFILTHRHILIRESNRIYTVYSHCKPQRKYKKQMIKQKLQCLSSPSSMEKIFKQMIKQKLQCLS